jgi:hypothetical protein
MSIKTKYAVVFAIIAMVSLIGLVIFAAILISPGSHGSVVRYQVNASKKIVYESIKGFVDQNSSFRMPKELEEFSFPKHFTGNDSLDRVNPMNADSVNFFFFIKEKNIMLWATFPMAAVDWTHDGCDLILVGFVDQGRIMQYGEKMSNERQAELKEIFESQILQRLNNLKFTAR